MNKSEIIKLFGSYIAFYREIKKDIDLACGHSKSVSYMIPSKGRTLIHLDKLKAACFDELIEHSFTESEIAIIVSKLKEIRYFRVSIYNTGNLSLSDRIISVIKLLKE